MSTALQITLLCVFDVRKGLNLQACVCPERKVHFRPFTTLSYSLVLILIRNVTSLTAYSFTGMWPSEAAVTKSECEYYVLKIYLVYNKY